MSESSNTNTSNNNNVNNTSLTTQTSSEEETSVDETSLADDDDAEGERNDLDQSQKSILVAVLSQLKIGMDLTKVTIPTYFLEPRSLLEKLTDFMIHPQFIVQALQETDPVQRMIGVVRWYLSGWHIRPKGVKKPYNPIGGEIFRCYQKLDDKAYLSFFAEQVSHHPPISAFYGECTEKQVRYDGWYYPRSKFLGNTAASLAEGILHIYLDQYKEKYVCTWPSLYARGIIFGTMLMEMGGKTCIECEESDLITEMEFKTKGFWGGEYNVIVGKIRSLKGKTFYEFEGKWNDIVFIKKHKHHSHSKTIIDPAFPIEELLNAKLAKRFNITTPLAENQMENESRKVWQKVTEDLRANNHDAATQHKSEIETEQRRLREEREQRKETLVPKYFKKNEEGDTWAFIGQDRLLFGPDSDKSKSD